MMNNKVCKNGLCLHYNKRFPNNYIYCPFCGHRLLMEPQKVEARTVKVFSNTRKETIDLNSIPRFDSKNPDAFDRRKNR